VDANPKIASIDGTLPYIESLTRETTPFGTLCYHSRYKRNWFNIGGMMLCRENNGANSTGIIPIGLFMYNTRQNEIQLIQELEWSSTQSIVVTLQLWQAWDNNALEAVWKTNSIEIKSIEYSDDRKMVRPGSGDDENSDKCYGVRVVMDRSVYQVYDGKYLLADFGEYISLIGAVYSFFILSLGICAKCWDKVIERFFQSVYDKDHELMTHDGGKKKEAVQMGQANTKSNETEETE